MTAIFCWLFPIPNVFSSIYDFIKYLSKLEYQKQTDQKDSISVSNLLACLGNTAGEQRHKRLSVCLDGVSLPATTTAEQILGILGTIPGGSQWRCNDLVNLIKNNNITISGHDATILLNTFGTDIKKSALLDISCNIEKPIQDSDKNELLKGIDTTWISAVRHHLEKSNNPPCER